MVKRHMTRSPTKNFISSPSLKFILVRPLVVSLTLLLSSYNYLQSITTILIHDSDMATPDNPVPHLLYHDLELHLLICLDCAHALNPENVQRHISETHQDIPKAIRKLIVPWAQSLEAVTELAQLQLPPCPLAIPNIAVSRTGFKCLGCDSCYGMLSTVEKHVRTHHPNVKKDLVRCLCSKDFRSASQIHRGYTSLAVSLC